jgi:hypothetical protein
VCCVVFVIARVLVADAIINSIGALGLTDAAAPADTPTPSTSMQQLASSKLVVQVDVSLAGISVVVHDEHRCVELFVRMCE